MSSLRLAAVLRRIGTNFQSTILNNHASANERPPNLFCFKLRSTNKYTVETKIGALEVLSDHIYDRMSTIWFWPQHVENLIFTLHPMRLDMVSCFLCGRWTLANIWLVNLSRKIQWPAVVIELSVCYCKFFRRHLRIIFLKEILIKLTRGPFAKNFCNNQLTFCFFLD